MKKLLLLLFLAIATLTSLSAQCPSGYGKLKLVVNSDFFWQEVSWTVTDPATGTVIQGSVPDSSTHIYEYCVPDSSCTEFKMSDTYGDGMLPDGYYRLYFNDSLIFENLDGEFQYNQVTIFNCEPGTYCDYGFPIQTGNHEAPWPTESWYKFAPDSTGIYEISTCDSLNTCPSKIWVYNTCKFITNTQAGTLFYSDGGCTNGAFASLHLEGGKKYQIRLAFVGSDSCVHENLRFSLTYKGPIVGCTDPLACNYDPLATISDSTCIYPGDPECPDAPDLVVLEDVLRNSMNLVTMTNGDVCAVEEGCLRGVGTRYLINFTTHIKNIGTKDYFIGQTPDDTNTPTDQFLWDPCHQHWHYRGYAEYVLFQQNGDRVPVGSKNGFCVLDLECNDGGQGKYTCENMGISNQCGDIYDAGLPCQWVDITGISPGTYTLVVRVNWDQSPDVAGNIESDFENNWAQACFNLTYTGATPNVEFLDDECPAYYDCLGTLFGDAQPDCEGVCNGTALRGDWNQDTMRTIQDIEAYLEAALYENPEVTNCRDLQANGNLDLYDAALLQECEIHANDPQYWLLRFPCTFPTGTDLPNEPVTLKLTALDTVAKTVDVMILNAINRVLGYEFSIAGLKIESLVDLSPDFEGDLQFDSTGEIMALSYTEKSIKKNTAFTKFLRIHYSTLTNNEICISEITTIVNSKYQRSTPNIGSCINTSVAAPEIEKVAYDIYVQPNPFSESTTLYFNNEAGESLRVTLSDLTGRVVRSFDGVRDDTVVFERNGLPAGTYIYTVLGAKGSVSGKIVAW